MCLLKTKDGDGERAEDKITRRKGRGGRRSRAGGRVRVQFASTCSSGDLQREWVGTLVDEEKFASAIR